MVDLTIRDIPEPTAAALERFAARRGLGLEAAARDVLAEALRGEHAARMAEAARIRALTPPGPQTDAADILAIIRGERGTDRAGD